MERQGYRKGKWLLKLILILIVVADIAGGKEAEGVWEHGVEENIWT